ncbi:hypothetical protein Tco_1576891 [Tanacetum coccineum]
MKKRSINEELCMYEEFLTISSLMEYIRKDKVIKLVVQRLENKAQDGKRERKEQKRRNIGSIPEIHPAVRPEPADKQPESNFQSKSIWPIGQAEEPPDWMDLTSQSHFNANFNVPTHPRSKGFSIVVDFISLIDK